MPPSREYIIVFNQERIKELEAHLSLRAPVKIKLDTTPNKQIDGSYHHSIRKVTLQIGQALYAGSRLTHVKNEILETLLHEFRHAHQHDNWPAEKIVLDTAPIAGMPGYVWNSAMEADAEEWALANRDKWRDLFKIKPTVHSNLSRLSQAEGRARA